MAKRLGLGRLAESPDLPQKNYPGPNLDPKPHPVEIDQGWGSQISISLLPPIVSVPDT